MTQRFLRPLVILFIALLATTAQAQITFVEVTDGAGIGPYTMQLGKGGGVAAADFDDDGDVDLFAPTEEGIPHQLYRNLGNGQFEEIGAAAGVGSLDRGRAAIWFDYDGDRRLDLFIISDCSDLTEPDATQCIDSLTLKLYRQIADAQFQEVTTTAGFTSDTVFNTTIHRGGLSAGDINNDQCLDLVFGSWSGQAKVYLNNCDGTFTDISAMSGIGGIFGYHWMPMIHDFNGDGWKDVYYNIDFGPNALFVNQGDNTFVNVADVTGCDSNFNEMGMSFGDYDADGDFDIYATNIFIPEDDKHNVLMRNDTIGGTLAFTELAATAGVDDTFFGWGTTFFDADNDGDVDLGVTNGFFMDSDPSVFFRNEGDGTFTDVSDAVGFNDTYWGSSLVAFDYDRDGDLDLAQTCNGAGEQDHRLRLIENQRGMDALANNHLVVKPRMEGPNYRAIGAVVRAEVGGESMMRLLTAGTSFAGQEPAEAFFGVGTATTVDRVIIDWPDGTSSELTDVAVNQEVRVELLFADGFESGDLAGWSSVQP